MERESAPRRCQGAPSSVHACEDERLKEQRRAALYRRATTSFNRRRNLRLADYDAAVAVAASRPSPPAVIREELQDARARGVEWEQAWRDATARALRDIPGGQRHRQQWIETVAWSKKYFRYAYTRRGRDPGKQIYDLARLAG
jgi:hypothetical protein